MFKPLRSTGAALVALVVTAGSAALSQAMTLPAEHSEMYLPVADTGLGSGGIQTWIKLTELDGGGETDKPAQTLFVPSDEAFKSLPSDQLSALMTPERADSRRAFLARAGTTTRVSPNELAGQRITVRTLDGRLLVIDSTGSEVMVGDAEAVDIRQLPDGRMLFVLDHVSLK